MLTILTVKFQAKIWLHILKKVLQWLWTIIHQVQIKIQSQQVYMIWKRRMAQQKVRTPCPFIVHGLTGEEFSTKTMKTIKAIALRHLTSEGKILAIGHAETPES